MKNTQLKMMAKAKNVEEAARIKTIGEYITARKYKVKPGNFKAIISRTRNSSLESTLERIDLMYNNETTQTKGVKKMNVESMAAAQVSSQKVIDLITEISMKEKVEVSVDIADDIFELIDENNIDILDEKKFDAFLKDFRSKIKGCILASALPKADSHLDGRLHDELKSLIDKTGNTSDTFLFALFDGYARRGAIQTEFISTALHYFDNDKTKMAAYFRGITGTKASITKNTGYMTADSLRIVGDAMELAIVTAAKLSNTYAFQKPANGIDKLVGRPEELDENVVKSMFSNVVSSVKSKKKGAN